jgi:hypothetical protein
MKNKISLSLILLLICNSYIAQTEKTYRLFSKEFDRLILSFTIKDKKEIQVIGAIKTTNEEKRFTENLEKTSNENISFFRIDRFGDKTKMGNMLIQFEDSSRVLKILIDTTFKNKSEIENFIVEKKNIESQLVFYLIEGIRLEQVKQFPIIRNIKPEEIQILKNKYTVHYEPLAAMFNEKTSLFSKLGMALYFSNQAWINAQCLLLGYKQPQTNEEYEYLKNAMK